MPMRARKNTIVGIWKMTPKASSILTQSEKTSEIFGLNSRYRFQAEKNFHVYGNAT